MGFCRQFTHFAASLLLLVVGVVVGSVGGSGGGCGSAGAVAPLGLVGTVRTEIFESLKCTPYVHTCAAPSFRDTRPRQFLLDSLFGRLMPMIVRLG